MTGVVCSGGGNSDSGTKKFPAQTRRECQAALQLQIALFDPAPLAQHRAEQAGQHRGQHKADEHKAHPVEGGDGDAVLHPAGVHADLAHQTAGAHAGGDGRAVHFQTEQAGGQRPRDDGGQRRGNPHAGVLEDVGHLQHAGADALAHKAAHAVFLVAHEGKADHLGAAARHRRAAGKAGQAQRRADGRRGDGQGQRHAHQNRHQNAHQEGLQLGGPHDEGAHRAGRRADGRGEQRRQARAHQNRHRRGDENVHLSFLAHQLAELRRHDGNEVHRQRAACAAQRVGRRAHRDEAEQHQLRRVQCVADGYRHGRPRHTHGVGTRVHQKRDAHLLAQRLDDGADEQAGEQSLRHGRHGVNAIAVGRDDHVLALAETLKRLHDSFHIPTPYLGVGSILTWETKKFKDFHCKTPPNRIQYL